MIRGRRRADALVLALALLDGRRAATADPALLLRGRVRGRRRARRCAAPSRRARAPRAGDRAVRGDRAAPDTARLGTDPGVDRARLPRDRAGVPRRCTRAPATRSRQRDELLRAHPHPHSEAAVARRGATAAHIRGDHEDALPRSAAAIASADRGGPHSERLASRRRCTAGRAWRPAQPEEGLTSCATRHRALDGDRCRRRAAVRARAARPTRSRTRATRRRRCAALDAALGWVDGGERWYAPELHRMRAELLPAAGDLAARAPQRRQRRLDSRGAWRRRLGASRRGDVRARLGSATPVA